AAEEAALEIGAASLEAADQARRAAALAERASAAAVRAADAASAPPGAPVPSAPVAVSAEAPSVEAPPRSGLTSDAPPSDLLASVEPSTTSPPASNGASPPDSDPFEERIAAFQERAERVMVRLRRLEAPGSTAGLR
ncbi:MAG: hypothetical protein JSS97_19240, partial [Actinobacteria bacterium]|nr:hypothetical protein [Actinomycetota bacterium]